MKSFINFLVRDPLRKLLALALTVVLYAVLNEGKQQQKDIGGILVELRCDDGVFLTMANQSIPVRLTLRGSESRIKNLNAANITGRVDISRSTPGFDSGTLHMRLSADNFTCPRGIEIVNINPDVLVVPVQRKISREVAIKPAINGRPRRGWEFSDIRCFPASVLVTGPESAVNALEHISTESLNVPADETATFSKSLSLRNPMPHEFGFSIVSTNVTVTISRMLNIRHRLDNIPVQWFMPQNPDWRLTPTVSTAAVMLVGTQDAVMKVLDKDVLVYADLTKAEFAGDEFEAALQAVIKNADGSVKIVSIDPAKIKVKCKKVK